MAEHLAAHRHFLTSILLTLDIVTLHFFIGPAVKIGRPNNSIRKCCSDSVVIGKPIIDSVEANEISRASKDNLRNNFSAIFLMLRFNKKEGNTRKKYLCLSGC